METSLIHQLGADLQAEMERAVASPVQLLHDMLSFQVRGGAIPGNVRREGHPRGILCLVVCVALSGDHRRALPAAAAVELAHQQFLVHRGIGVTGNQITGDSTRIEGRWGSGQAINAGDGLHAKSRLCVMRLAEHGCDDEAVLGALRMLDDACARTSESLHTELLAAGNPQSQAWNPNTGSLMGCAAQLASLLAGKNASMQQLALQSGSDLGAALQIQEDAVTSGDSQAGLGPDGLQKVLHAREGLSRIGVGESHLDDLERLLGLTSAEGAEEKLG